MPNYHISAEADDDLLDIAKYTMETWGIKQSLKYKEELMDCFQNLAENPDIGRDASHFSRDLLRYSYKAHAIFFKQVENDILIIRVLGQKMDFEGQFRS